MKCAANSGQPELTAGGAVAADDEAGCGGTDDPLQPQNAAAARAAVMMRVEDEVLIGSHVISPGSQTRGELRCCAYGRVRRGYANMSSVRATGWGLVAAAAALGGCASAGVSPEPPAGAGLAGAWKLDHAASDDPQKILDQMRAEAIKIIRRHQQQQAAQASVPVRPGMRGGPAQQDEPSADEDVLSIPGPNGQRPDPLQRSPMARVILDTVARGDFLTVRQSANEVVFDYGTSRRSYTPGARSVVSTETGVGDQISGWKGRDYVIEVKGQLGPNVTDRYGLSSDGHELIENLHIGAGELPAVNLTRIYRPTTEIAPQQLPSTE